MRNLRLLSVLFTALILTLALVAGSAARAASTSAPKLERSALPQPAASQPAPPALATSPSATQRSFVSGLGSDANSCTRTAPCRNFAKAISETLANGEVIVLDSAGYGPFTVDKAIHIIAPSGVYAGVTSFAGDAITVNAPSATVVLRGLTLNGLGGGVGVNLVAADRLYLQQMTLKKFLTAGLNVNMPAGSPTVFVEDSLAHDNWVGIYFQSGTPVASVDDSRLERNGAAGLGIGTAAKVTARDVVAFGNVSYGFDLFPNTGGELNLEHSASSNNTRGIYAGVGHTVRVAETMLTNNSSTAVAGSGMRLTWGNNRVAGNGGDCCFSGTIAMQ